VGCPIRRSRDHRALAPPPSFSQRATSFIASRCQGIHQMPLSCSPTPSPKAALRAARGQRSEVRDQTRLACLCSPSSALWSLRKDRPYRGHAPRRICIPMPGHDRSTAQARRPGRSILSCPLHGHDSLHDVKNASRPHAAPSPGAPRADLVRAAPEDKSPCQIAPTPAGGPGPIRTADLTLIRRAL
jgi:hypothetical protein